MLLDEPFCSLDAGLRASLRQEFMEVRSRYGIPSIVVTHGQEDAEALQGQAINYYAFKLILQPFGLQNVTNFYMHQII